MIKNALPVYSREWIKYPARPGISYLVCNQTGKLLGSFYQLQAGPYLATAHGRTIGSYRDEQSARASVETRV